MELLDILGVLIAFATVMLLLSLSVTAAVQALQAVLGLRTRNLRVGLAQVLNGVLNMPIDQARQRVDRVFACLRNDGARKRDAAASPAVTWIPPEELPRWLSQADVPTQGREAEIVGQLQAIGPYLSKRFTHQIRAVTVLVGFLVAGWFQVSAPSLLADLAGDRTLRERIAGDAMAVAGEAREILSRLPHPEDVADRALAELEARHPELEERIEEAAGLGHGIDALVDELRTVLGDSEGTAGVLAEYEALLVREHEAALDRALDDLGTTTARLSSFELEPWPEGWSFYRDPAHLFGVLLTGILLSFGAPFWFELLGSLARLRDVLDPSNRKRDDGAASADRSTAAVQSLRGWTTRVVQAREATASSTDPA